MPKVTNQENLLLTEKRYEHSCIVHSMGERLGSENCLACAYEKGVKAQLAHCKPLIEALKDEEWGEKHYNDVMAAKKSGWVAAEEFYKAEWQKKLEEAVTKISQLFEKEKREIFKALEDQGLVPNERIYNTDGYYTPDELQYNKRFERYQSLKSRFPKGETCPLCGKPSKGGKEHKECMDYEAMRADRG